MPQPTNPHSRSRYPREIIGGVTILKIKGELRKLWKSATPLDPNRCAVSQQDFRTLERELLGKTDTGSELSIANPETNTLVVINHWSSVKMGTVEFWFQA